MEVMRSWFDTWNRGDLDAFIDLYAVDAEVTLPASWVETGTVEGRPAIRRFFGGLKESWEGHDEAVLREVFRAGDAVVSRMDWQARGRGCGLAAQMRGTYGHTAQAGQRR